MGNRWLGSMAVVIATACSSSSSSNSGGGNVIHCTYAAQGECFTVTAPSFTTGQRTALQNECTGDGGAFGAGACATTSAVAGTCTVTDPSSLVTTQVAGLSMTANFYTPSFDATSAAAACASFGTWSGGGGGGGGGNITTARCNMPSNGFCATLTAPAITPAQQTALQAECTADGGTWGTTACSTANTVTGTCTVTGASYLPTTQVSGLVMTLRFYTPTFDATTAANQCTTMGTWSGGGGGGGGTETVVSCYVASSYACVEYRASPVPSTFSGPFQSGCTGNLGGVYAAGPCPSASVVPGYCLYDASADLGAGGTERDYLYGPTFNASSAQANCAAPPAGTWVP